MLLLGGDVVIDGRAAGNVIGVLRSDVGTVRPVHSPFDSIRPSVTFAARASSDRWHVILVVGARKASNDPLAYDSAAIWYAQIDSRGGWHDLTQIAIAQGARFGYGLQSDLQVTPDGVAFAYPFVRSFVRQSNATGNQGIVLIRQVNKTWRFDTLGTWNGPNAVQLAITPTGALQALFNSRIFLNRRILGPYLNQAIFVSKWTTISTLVRPIESGQSIRFPLQRSEPGALPVVLWRESMRPQFTDRMLVGLVSADSIQVFPDQVGEIYANDQPAMIIDSTLGVLVFSRASKEDSTVRVTLATQNRSQLIGTINEGTVSPAIYAVKGKAGKIDLVVGRVDESGRSTTMIITLAVHCGVSSKKSLPDG